MLEQRRHFFGYEEVQLRAGQLFPQRAERRRHQHRVAEVFELQGEDFFRPRVHYENCSS